MPAQLNGQFAAYQLRYGREDTFSTSLRESLLFFSTFTIVGIEMGVVYRMEVRASSRSLIGGTLWGPYSVIRVRDGKGTAPVIAKCCCIGVEYTCICFLTEVMSFNTYVSMLIFIASANKV